MEPDDATDVTSSKGRTTAIGSLIAVFVLVDAYLIGIPVVILAALTRPGRLRRGRRRALSFVDVRAPSTRGVSVQLARPPLGRLVRERASRQAREAPREAARESHDRHPVSWISRGSDFWFALAAAMVNAITVIALARVIGGKPVGRHRVLVAGIAYSIFFAALFSIIGTGLSDVIRGAT